MYTPYIPLYIYLSIYIYIMIVYSVSSVSQFCSKCYGLAGKKWIKFQAIYIIAHAH